jgi:integrase
MHLAPHELDSDGLAFGLCDLGMGEPELGYVSLTELRTVRGKLGLPIERDLPLSVGPGRSDIHILARQRRVRGATPTRLSDSRAGPLDSVATSMWQGAPTAADIAKVHEWLGHANIAATRIYDRRKSSARTRRRLRSATEERGDNEAPDTAESRP